SVYLSAMRAGARGEWLRTSPFTNEPHAAAPYYPFYLLLGHIAPPTLLTYHLARLLMTVLLGFALWALIAEILPHPAGRRVAFTLALLGMGLGWVIAVSGLWQVIRPADIYAPTATLLATSLVNPHFPLAVALEFVVLYLYLHARRGEAAGTNYRMNEQGTGEAARTHQRVNEQATRAPLRLYRARLRPYPAGAIGWGALAFLGIGLVLPFNLLIVGAIILTDMVGEGWRERRLWTPAARAGLLILLPGGLFGLYYVALFTLAPFWSEWYAQRPPLEGTLSSLDFAAGYAPLLLLALAGAAIIWRSPAKSPGERLLLAWLLSNSLLIAAPLGVSNRMSLGFGAVLAMLSAIAALRFSLLLRWFALRGVRAKRRATRLLVHAVIRARRFAPAGVLIVALPSALTLSLGLPLVARQTGDLPYYLPQKDAKAMRWLASHTVVQDVVLASPAISNLIPASTDARVYTGHAFETFQIKRKNAEVREFFSAAEPDAARRNFLRQQGITWVYIEPNANGMGAFDGSGADYLEKAFSVDDLTVYRVVIDRLALSRRVVPSH
ncbi:MAG: hypothetical protein HYR71_08035, partial [Chloroflexi bacterium]|nr:hypothetical protein [Chloroflexota bacterium]